MISFVNLPMHVKTLLVTTLFLSLCTGVCLNIIVGKKQGKLRQLLLIASTLALSIIMLLYASIIPAERAKPNIPSIVLRFTALPVVFPVLLFVIIIAFYVLIIHAEHARRKMAITLSSIKESLDHLQTGLCFSQKNGLVLLTNHRMNELSYTLFGRSIQNAHLFWQALCSSETSSHIKRLSSGEHPEFHLQDGRIWLFKYEKLNSIIQITAAETTKQHQLLSELQLRNTELETMNKRIRSYGEKVDEYTIARERLETRVNLHGFLGQSLLVTRHYLKEKISDSGQILDIWQRNINILRLEAEPEKKEDSLVSLQRAAKAIGMQVHINGSLPSSAHLRKLLSSIGAEALTNAVRHAGAKQLFITAEKTELGYLIRYTNDGAVPEHTIVEGGGLSTTRRKVEAFGGAMQIESSPRFTLILFFSKEVTQDV